MTATVTATILNKTDITGLIAHTDFLMGVRLEDTGGGLQYGLNITATVDGAPFTPILKAPRPGDNSDYSNIITDIQIPADGQIDVWFLVQQRAALSGYFENIIYTATPVAYSGGVGTNGTPDTVTIDEADDLPDTKSEDQYLVGAGLVRIDGKDLGFYDEAGVICTEQKESTDITAGQVTGVLGSAPGKTKYIIKLNLKQHSLEVLKTIYNQVGDIENFTSCNVFGGQGTPRTGQKLTVKAEPVGIRKTHLLVVEGYACRRDDVDIAHEFFYTNIISVGDRALLTSKENSIPITIEAYCDGEGNFFTTYVADPIRT